MKEEIYKYTREFTQEKNLMTVNFVWKNLLQLEIEMTMREDMWKISPICVLSQKFAKIDITENINYWDI
jgi:hypothetical protein